MIPIALPIYNYKRRQKYFFLSNKTRKMQNEFPENLRNNFPSLRYLCKCRSRKEIKDFINHADKETIQCICECAHNILHGNIPIKKGDIKKLKKYQNVLSTLLDKRSSLKKRKEVIIQKGGFLPLLLSPVLGIVGSLIGDAIAKSR